jgi:hypothetical protein
MRRSRGLGDVYKRQAFAACIAESRVSNPSNSVPALLINLYIARLYYFLNYWSTGTPTLIRTEKIPPFERDDFTNLSMGA